MRNAKVVQLTIEGEAYVAIPRAEYQAMTDKGLEGAVDAAEFVRAKLGRTLRAAREAAGLTQAQLAEKLGKAQPMVSGAETGAVHVGHRYVDAVLKACGLPADWKAPKGAAVMKKSATVHFADPRRMKTKSSAIHLGKPAAAIADISSNFSSGQKRAPKKRAGRKVAEAS